MSNAMTWRVNVVIAAALAFLQFLLTPFLTFEGRGIRAMLRKDDTLFVCAAVFLMVLAASFRATTLGKPALLWHYALRALLWGAVLT